MTPKAQKPRRSAAETHVGPKKNKKKQKGWGRLTQTLEELCIDFPSAFSAFGFFSEGHQQSKVYRALNTRRRKSLFFVIFLCSHTRFGGSGGRISLFEALFLSWTEKSDNFLMFDILKILTNMFSTAFSHNKHLIKIAPPRKISHHWCPELTMPAGAFGGGAFSDVQTPPGGISGEWRHVQCVTWAVQVPFNGWPRSKPETAPPRR